jgi:hypothetical protein
MNNLGNMRNKVSLRLSLSSAFIITVVVTTAIFGLCTYHSVRSFVRSEIRERLSTAVAIAAIEIDPKIHSQVQIKGDEGNSSYLSIRDKLRRIRNSTKDLKYVYTFRKVQNGGIVFIVDAEESEDKVSHTGDPYESASAELLATFNPPYRVHVESDFSKDEWGTWLSAFAPILDSSGKLEGVIGMDMAAKKIIEYERKYLLAIIAISLPLVLLVGLFGLFFSRQISLPIMALAAEMKKIQRLNLQLEDQKPSRIFEIGEMRDAVLNMKRGLRSFSRYVPIDIVRDLIELQKEAEIGAEKREMTFFFSDLANFTKICEQWPPDVLATQLDAYFEVMTKQFSRWVERSISS